MQVKLKSKQITGLENTSYDLTIQGHWGGFLDKLYELYDNEVEYSVMQITEQELHFHKP